MGLIDEAILLGCKRAKRANPGGHCWCHPKLKCIATGYEKRIPYQIISDRYLYYLVPNMCPIGCTNKRWPKAIFLGCQWYVMHPLPDLTEDVVFEQIVDITMHELLHAVLDHVGEDEASSGLDRLHPNSWYDRNGLDRTTMQILDQLA